jgi:hypothetical protein
LHEVIQLRLLYALPKSPVSGKRCIIVVIHHEKRTAFQTRDSAFCEYESMPASDRSR